MLKKYIAKSCVSISVALPTGGTTHVSFTPRTGGGSVYYTDNEKIQEGLKKHPKFGKLFKLDESTPAGSSKPAKTGHQPTDKREGEQSPLDEQPGGDNSTSTTGAASEVEGQGDNNDSASISGEASEGEGQGTDSEDGEQGAAGSTFKEVEVTCNDDAKDYLAERFNVSRSKLRNRSEIDATAEANGVKFVWK